MNQIEPSIFLGSERGPNQSIGITIETMNGMIPYRNLCPLSSMPENDRYMVATHSSSAMTNKTFSPLTGFVFIMDFSVKSKKYSDRCCDSQILCIFAVSRFVRAEWPENVRAFLLAHKISGVALPSVSYNDLLSPDKGLDTGEGDTVFLLPVLNLIEMSKNLSSGNATPSGLFGPNEIIQSITSSDELQTLRDHLRSLLDAYLLQEDQEMLYPKGAIYGTFLVFDYALKMMERRVAV